jgi:hypothetical protein
MRQTILFLLCFIFLFSTGSLAQSSAGTDFVKGFIEKFNDKKYDSIYSKTNLQFQDRISLANFTSILTSVAQQTGSIHSFVFVEKKDKAIEVFHLLCEKQSVVLTLALDDLGKASTLLLRPLQANAEKKKSVEQLLDEWKKDASSQALVIGEVSKDDVRYQFLGKVSREKPTAPTMQTLFEIGSITKPLTGLIYYCPGK